jgi:6-phosphogluconolactonase
VTAVPQVVVLPTAADVAADVAARLLSAITELQGSGVVPSVVLTGGNVGIASLRLIRESDGRDTVDWRRVELYWGDERFVPADSDDRNAKQAREALLDDLDLDPALVHEMAPSDGEFGDDVDAAAAAYASIVDSRGPFDVTILGIGPDGHVASIFPGHPGVFEEGTAISVRNSPKPPPTRISLTLPTIRRSAEVWVVTGGTEKADAVSRAFGGSGEVDIPAVGARGTRRTLWLLDTAAAAGLPATFEQAPKS